MTCKEVVERLSEYWSNELDERTRNEVSLHLQGCPSCQHEWAIFQTAMNALKSVTTPEPSPELLSRIQSAVMAKQSRKPVFVWRWQWAMATGAATIVIALVSVSFFSRVRERTWVPPSHPIVAEQPVPLLPSPALRQPLPPSSVTPPSLKPQPSPAEQIAKPRRLSAIERRRVGTASVEKKQGYTESGKLSLSSPPTELPPLEVPRGERLPERSEKDIPAEIAPPAEQTTPKLAELPVELRIVPFKVEAKLSERVQVPETRETERTTTLRGPIGPMGQQSPAGPQGPIIAAPAMSAAKKIEGETQTPALIGQHFPMAAQQPMQQYGGGLGQSLFAIPFALRWAKFEPVVVGKVTLWQLMISSDSPQVVTVYLRPGEKVEILNAQQPVTGEGKGLVIWRDKVHFGRGIFIPILIRANEAGTRKLLVTLETMDGKTFSWWCLFPAMPHEEQPKIRRPVTLQIEQWTILDLFAHLAWETKASFLLPEEIGYRTINVPTKSLSLSEIFVLLERQIGIKWQRFGHTFSLTAPIPVPIAPMMKQQ